MSRNLGTENFHSVPFAGNTFFAPLVPNRQNRVHGGPLRAPSKALPAAPVTNESSEKARFRVDMSKSKLEMVGHFPTDSRQQ